VQGMEVSLGVVDDALEVFKRAQQAHIKAHDYSLNIEEYVQPKYIPSALCDLVSICRRDKLRSHVVDAEIKSRGAISSFFNQTTKLKGSTIPADSISLPELRKCLNLAVLASSSFTDQSHHKLHHQYSNNSVVEQPKSTPTVTETAQHHQYSNNGVVEQLRSTPTVTETVADPILKDGNRKVQGYNSLLKSYPSSVRAAAAAGIAANIAADVIESTRRLRSNQNSEIESESSLQPPQSPRIYPQYQDHTTLPVEASSDSSLNVSSLREHVLHEIKLVEKMMNEISEAEPPDKPYEDSKRDDVNNTLANHHQPHESLNQFHHGHQILEENSQESSDLRSKITDHGVSFKTVKFVGQHLTPSKSGHAAVLEHRLKSTTPKERNRNDYDDESFDQSDSLNSNQVIDYNPKTMTITPRPRTVSKGKEKHKKTSRLTPNSRTKDNDFFGEDSDLLSTRRPPRVPSTLSRNGGIESIDRRSKTSLAAVKYMNHYEKENHVSSKQLTKPSSSSNQTSSRNHQTYQSIDDLDLSSIHDCGSSNDSFIVSRKSSVK